MNLDTHARASTQAIRRSRTRLDPLLGLDDLQHRHRRRQRLQRAGVGALALLVVVVAVWTGVVLRGPTPIQPTLGPVERFRVGPAPVSVAVTPDAAWVLNSGNDTISRVDPGTGRLQATFSLGGDLIFATAADGRLWVVHPGPDVNEVAISSIDPSTGKTLTTFGFGGYALNELAEQAQFFVGSGAVWVSHQGADEVRRFDAATGTLLDRIRLPEPTALAVDDRTVWVGSADGRLRSIDIDTGAVRVRATTTMVPRIRVGQGAVWLMTFDGKVLRVDRRTGRVVAQVPGTFQAADLAVGAEGVWVYDQRQGAVLRIDSGTNRVARTIPVISQPLVELDSRVLALGAGAVWVVDHGAEALVRVDPYR